jgi:hypothetical protein
MSHCYFSWYAYPICAYFLLFSLKYRKKKTENKITKTLKKKKKHLETRKWRNMLVQSDLSRFWERKTERKVVETRHQMAGSTSRTCSSNPSLAPPPPKILLVKPRLVTSGSVVGKFGRGSATDDEMVSLRSRLPSIGSLNLPSDS